eukprot:TRINITY_DN8686_c0_g1_i1.p1 TRINITY_DN8686_c0_g1~~TRINITY_DN8686_c0_g1_i1.p1  ORF type:complete len:369 (+),score=65.34 TRINITY_DN8686_c0_g1_i1:289-1395(+)
MGSTVFIYSIFKESFMIPTCGGNYSFIIVPNNLKIIGWGSNDKGQLALEYSRNIITLPPNFIDTLMELSIIKISCYHKQSWGISQDGFVFTWGHNILGYDPAQVRYDKWKKDYFDSPKKILYIEGAIDICCNDYSVAILRENGTVYMASSFNIKGKDFDENCFEIVDVDEDIISVHSGGSYLIFLTSEGNLYCIGDNTYGQLGLGHVKRIYEISKVETVENIISIDCGYFHSVALDAEYNVWVWGYNGNCELAREFPWILENPTKMDSLPENVRKVICGYQHTLVLTEDGDLWSWGNNVYGQLGIDEQIKCNYVPRLILTNVDNVSASTFNIATTIDDKIYVWGDNRLSHLISGQDDIIFNPIEIDML